MILHVVSWNCHVALHKNVLWDKAGRYERFADVDSTLRGLGRVSVYHHKTGVGVGG